MNNRNVIVSNAGKKIDELMVSVGASPEMKAAIIGAVQLIAYEAYMNGKVDTLTKINEGTK
jgi:chloramphenicol 3-O-phosphotransferase